MNTNQITALRCAYADLQGSRQAFDQMDSAAHDWRAHDQSILDLEKEFPFLVDGAPAPQVDNIPKAASFFLSSWPDRWTSEELIEAIRKEDPDVVVRDCFDLEPMEHIALWIEEVAGIFS